MSSGLSGANYNKARDLILQAAVGSYHHRESIGYTQGARRCEGIERRLKAYLKEYPHWGDCSAMSSWWMWNGYEHFGKGFECGWTGSLCQHGRRVFIRKPCDLVFYGRGKPWEHVAMYTGGGLVVSHGSSAGPLLLPVGYRSDVGETRRYL